MHNYNLVRMAKPTDNFERLPENHNDAPAVRRKRSLGYTTKFWENASTITFSFMHDVSDELKYRIELGIRKWEPFVSLAFELVENVPGMIRIALQGKDSYSFIGIDAMKVDVNEPTMVLGTTPDSPLFDHTVQHELATP